jgi:hypothetical protein
MGLHSDQLPAKAKRGLVGILSLPVGTRLSISWYEFMRSSNFDKFPRERIRDAAEADGFVVYREGHPWVTETGFAWARSQVSR